MRARTIAVLVALVGGCTAPRRPAVPPSAQWLSNLERDIERRFRLNDSMVGVAMDIAANDSVPAVEVMLSEAATAQLGYNKGTFPTDRLLQAIWQNVPAAVQLRGVTISLRELDGVRRSSLVPTDTLDRSWPRRK